MRQYTNRLTTLPWRLVLIVLLVFGVAKPVVRDAQNSNFLAAHLVKPGYKQPPQAEVEAYRAEPEVSSVGR
jgi:hypothetical protein